jgi:hypothetical protein
LNDLKKNKVGKNSIVKNFKTVLGTGKFLVLNIDPKNIFSLFNFRVVIQDGEKIQNGTQKRKIIIFIFAVKWPKINEF